VALSHCWGSSIPVTTTLDKLDTHKTAIKLNTLPRTFRDAIEITRKLGFSYLWIDSLCIIQDSEEDWAHECSKMAAIYAQATLVLAAASASDSSQGFLNHRELLQSPPIGSDAKHVWQEQITARKERLELPLASRAWAYQEIILAPRLLQYTKTQMSWECRHGIKNESVEAVDSSNNSCSKKEFYRVLDTPIPDLYPENTTSAAEIAKQLSDSMNHQSGPTAKTPSSESKSISKITCDRMNIWLNCVEDYSHRSLTHASDKLPALSGLASAVHHPLLGNYLAGLWSKDLGSSLLGTTYRKRRGL
jgi:hypothetical protein